MRSVLRRKRTEIRGGWIGDDHLSEGRRRLLEACHYPRPLPAAVYHPENTRRRTKVRFWDRSFEYARCICYASNPIRGRGIGCFLSLRVPAKPFSYHSDSMPVELAACWNRRGGGRFHRSLAW